jgi:hypothetical protein
VNEKIAALEAWDRRLALIVAGADPDEASNVVSIRASALS